MKTKKKQKKTLETQEGKGKTNNKTKKEKGMDGLTNLGKLSDMSKRHGRRRKEDGKELGKRAASNDQEGTEEIGSKWERRERCSGGGKRHDRVTLCACLFVPPPFK